MVIARNSRTARQRKRTTFGLLANGSSGGWEIAIDEATSGDERWFIQIEGPSVTFYFPIPALSVIGRMLRFLDPRRESTTRSPNGFKQNHSMVIGKDKEMPVILLRDDEYHDRFFLLIGLKNSPLARFVVAGTDAVQLAACLRQVVQDLDEAE